MSKTFYNVASGFTGNISLAGHGRSYKAGDVIVLDSDSLEDRAIRDLGSGPLSNLKAREAAFAALVTAGSIKYGGEISDPNSAGQCVWTGIYDLSALTNNQVIRFKPGQAGTIVGASALRLSGTPGSSKSGSFSFGVYGTSHTPVLNNASPAALALTSSNFSADAVVAANAFTSAKGFTASNFVELIYTTSAAFTGGVVAVSVTLDYT